MERAGRLADGWLGSFLTPDEAAVCRGQIKAAAAAAGRAIEEDHYGTNLLVALDEQDYDAAVARVAARRTDLAEPERLVCRGWDGARAELQHFVDVGLTKFVVRPSAPVVSRRDFVEQFSNELLPLQT